MRIMKIYFTVVFEKAKFENQNRLLRSGMTSVNSFNVIRVFLFMEFYYRMHFLGSFLSRSIIKINFGFLCVTSSSYNKS